MISQRDVESKRREAAKLFQAAALVILGEIDSSLTNLCGGIETGQSDVKKIATLSHKIR